MQRSRAGVPSAQAGRRSVTTGRRARESASAGRDDPPVWSTGWSPRRLGAGGSRGQALRSRHASGPRPGPSQRHPGCSASPLGVGHRPRRRGGSVREAREALRRSTRAGAARCSTPRGGSTPAARINPSKSADVAGRPLFCRRPVSAAAAGGSCPVRRTRNTAWGDSGNIDASAAMGNGFHNGSHDGRCPGPVEALRRLDERGAARHARPEDRRERRARESACPIETVGMDLTHDGIQLRRGVWVCGFMAAQPLRARGFGCV